MKHFLGNNNVRLKKHVNFVIYILFLYFCRPFFNIIQMYAIVEIAGQQFKVSEKQEVFVNRIDSKEGSKIILDKVLLLDKDGKMLSSKDFSVFLKKKMKERTKRICFLIGSDLGLDISLKKSFHTISLGRKTWPHLMVRIMLVEQIYRSFEIIKNSPYHK